eukprot:3199985-Pleurochrysis_carterae.AAC.2
MSTTEASITTKLLPSSNISAAASTSLKRRLNIGRNFRSTTWPPRFALTRGRDTGGSPNRAEDGRAWGGHKSFELGEVVAEQQKCICGQGQERDEPDWRERKGGGWERGEGVGTGLREAFACVRVAHEPSALMCTSMLLGFSRRVA